MNITITIYYKDLGANINKARNLMEKIQELATDAELTPNLTNWKHELSHCYFHETVRTTKTKAEKFAKNVKKLKNVADVSVEIKD